MDHVYTEAQLQHIIDEAVIYMCACPAQVARQLLDLRKLYRYQLNCEQSNAGQNEVHQTIGRSTTICHAEMEKCLGRILDIEGWDLATLTMPEGLRKCRDDLVQSS